MTKAELIEKVSEKIQGLTKRQTEVIVNSIFDSIKESLAKGNKIEIRGFGSFRIRQRRQRDGRNPKTGVSVSVPAKRVPFFKAGKELKEIVDKGNAS
ncbi:MAG: integration host factor subunit beta [Nitrospirae bacterium]|nr:integration host factor subunit beta [Nitrospirota bacterium]